MNISVQSSTASSFLIKFMSVFSLGELKAVLQEGDTL